MLQSLFNKFIGLQACSFTKNSLQHKRFPVKIANFKNNYFKKHHWTTDSSSSYILHRKLNRIIQEADWPSRLAFCLIWNINHSILLTLIRIHSFYDSLSFTVSHCHFFLLVVIPCHSLSLATPLAVTGCIIRCHLLYHSMPLVVPLLVIRFTTRCHLLSLVFIRCHSMYHSSVFLQTILIL